jgi:excalibur calcium-binding domain-containing protein
MRMRSIVLLLVIAGAAGWHFSGADRASLSLTRASVSTASEPAQFRCEGKVYCSQMVSCAEATFYLQHCPGVRIDGDGDGIPCESQWCGH